MLFDPRPIDESFIASGSGWTPSRQPPAARRRPAHGFLTLPTLPAEVPANGKLQYGDSADTLKLIRKQFETGVLAARDVQGATSAGDAFAQAMFTWLRRRMPKCKRLNFSFALLDQAAAREQVDQFGHDDDLHAPLYLAIELEQENVFEIGERADVMRRADPALLYTAIHLVDQAAGRSLYVRTPDDLADMFARWWWECDPTMSDEEAREFLSERFGGEDPDIERYLPSKVLPVLAPDDAVPAFARRDKTVRIQCLQPAQLKVLLIRQRGMPRRICRALLNLQAVLSRTTRSRALKDSQWAEPAYSATTLCMWREHWVGEILGDHFECLNNAGDATMYQSLIPLQSTPRAIRRQFKQLADMMDVIAALDRVLTIISE
ncbi:hypothetical protein D8I24_3456 (plasmid) [Cupriavidus necator H850]|uniref:PRTRC system protein F n=1 Tax=Cupriavidus necator TaxID=106590 RepID=UPI00129EEB21|nr:PRTRC system protein F [Cupriavidus necator]KAI3602155.1 hypothetical protein D8I24_3456 [Cupriavidus necator H850]